VKYMLKQSSSRMKKVLAIFMAVLFWVSLTAVAASAGGGGGGWGGYPWWIYGYPYGAYPYGAYPYGAYGGVPYMTGQYPAPQTSNQAPASTPAPKWEKYGITSDERSIWFWNNQLKVHRYWRGFR